MKNTKIKQTLTENKTNKEMSDSNVRFPSEETDAFISRLKSVISTESLSSFAKRCGFGESLLRKYLTGAVPGIDKAIAIANKNGRTVEWLLTGDWPEFKSDLRRALEYASADSSEIIRNFTGLEPADYADGHINKALQDNAQNRNPDTLYIQHFVGVKAAAGAGKVTPTDQTILQVAVNSADWRNYVGLDHRHIKVITVNGDSMKPTFSHGDQVLVDTACTNFIDDGVYAIQQGELLRIKRIKLKFDGSIEIKSDNAHGFANDSLTASEASDLIIYGRVIPFKFGRFDL